MRGATAAIALFVLGGIPVPGVARASDPPDTLHVSGEVSPAVVRVGERVTVRFRLPRPEGGRDLLGPPAPVELGPVDIVVSEPLATSPDSVGWYLEAAFFEYGEVDLAEVPFRLQTRDGEIPVRLEPYTISVVSSLPDSMVDADIRPITGPVEIPRRWRWGRIAAAGLILAALAAGAVFWWRRRPRATEAIAPTVPQLPPEVLALRALKELEEEALPARGRFKDHYARLSLILRHYLEGRFRIPAVESTTGEIRVSLDRGRQLEDEEKRTLLELFGDADLVKFAKWVPGAEVAADALGRSKSWVNRVSPPPAGEGGA